MSWAGFFKAGSIVQAESPLQNLTWVGRVGGEELVEPREHNELLNLNSLLTIVGG